MKQMKFGDCLTQQVWFPINTNEFACFVIMLNKRVPRIHSIDNLNQLPDSHIVLYLWASREFWNL